MGRLARALATRPMRDGEAPADTRGDGVSGDGVPRPSGSPRGGDTPRPEDTPHVLSSSRYLAWLYSPAHQQPVLAKLCEIESEIASSLRPGIDHHVAHTRLQWWREECERCAEGRPVHPLTRELVKAYGTTPLEKATSHPEGVARPQAGIGPPLSAVPSPLAGISGFADTAVWDLAGATFETRKELSAYCERWAVAMFETAAAQPRAHRQGEASLGTTTGWRALGAAVREIELLTNLAREAHAGRVRVPLDELDRAGVDVNVVAKPPWPDALATLLRERHKALRATIGSSLGALGPERQVEFRGLVVWAALAWRQSAREERALPNIILPRRYHAFADGWQAWRAARRAAAGNLRLS